MSLEEIYCFVDDFCHEFMPQWQAYLLTTGKQHRRRQGKLTISEMMTIYLLFQSSHYRNFKHYYLLKVLQGELKNAFPHAVSYTRFVALIPRLFVPLSAFLKTLCVDTKGIGFIDSTSINVCHAKRTTKHRVFREYAKLGKTTKGWFYGFKLHIITNANGDICACQLTPGNCDDRKPVDAMTKHMLGILCGDKGYIDKKLQAALFERGLQLVTGIRKKMKNQLLPMLNKILLRKRSLIESTNNLLKNTCHLEHSRHRSPINGFANILAAVIAYIFHPNKPQLKLNQFDLDNLCTS